MKKKGNIKVLVIRFSSIGDIVLTTPVLRCLKKIPGRQVELHVVTKKTYRPVLESNPHIDCLHLLDGGLRDILNKLRREEFDFVVDLHHNIRSTIVKLALRKPTASVGKLNFEKWLLTAFKINRLPDRHIVERYFEAAGIVGTRDDGGGLEFYFSEPESAVEAMIPGAVNSKLIAFVIGGKHATKRMPNEKIISICRRLPGKVVLLGGEEDAINGSIIAKASGEHVFNACGHFSLQQSAVIVKNAKAVISHDTGLMHIAAAFDKHVISVWGSTVPVFGMAPYMPKHPERSVVVEVNGLPCRPCTKIGFSKCPKKHFDCMMKIDEDRIVDNITKIAEDPYLLPVG